MISRGSKINADGTAEEPIVLPLSLEPALRGRRAWGGLVINGAAPINPPCGEAQADGGAGPKGGTSPDDDSGLLWYVRVELAGRKLSTQDDLNGTRFGGVGRGTTVDHVQVHMNTDDGLEFYGDTVAGKHLVITGVGDDSVDWTEGWQGSLQHALLVQYPGAGERVFEGDNLSANNDALPRSAPAFSNVIFLGCGEHCEGAGGDAILFRRGTVLFSWMPLDCSESRCGAVSVSDTRIEPTDRVGGLLDGDDRDLPQPSIAFLPAERVASSNSMTLATAGLPAAFGGGASVLRTRAVPAQQQAGDHTGLHRYRQRAGPGHRPSVHAGHHRPGACDVMTAGGRRV